MRERVFRRAVALILCLFITRGIKADDLQLQQITASLLKGIQQTGKKRVAVVDFVDLDGNPSRLGKYIAEELSVELTQAATGIEVVDRGHLQAILQEHKLKSDGLLDPATTQELGQLAGVDIIVTGSLTDVGDSIRIVAKALSTDSARIVAASSGTLPKTSQVSAMLSPVQIGSVDATHAPSTEPKIPNISSVEFKDIALSIQGCKISGKISCYGRITNNSSDSKNVLFFARGSHLIDNFGNESHSAGNYQYDGMTIIVGSGADMGESFYKMLEPGITLAIRFEGINLDPTASSVSIVLNTSEGTARLRDIPLVRR